MVWLLAAVKHPVVLFNKSSGVGIAVPRKLKTE